MGAHARRESDTMAKVWWGFVGVLSLVAVATGCKQGECSGNSDCGAGKVCLVDHTCGANVTKDTSKAAASASAGTSRITVQKSGSGDGSISSDPIGIDCGSKCGVDLLAGGKITLTAKPAADAIFSGWSGACDGVGTCDLTADGTALQVTAGFTRNPSAVASAGDPSTTGGAAAPPTPTPTPTPVAVQPTPDPGVVTPIIVTPPPLPAPPPAM